MRKHDIRVWRYNFEEGRVILENERIPAETLEFLQKSIVLALGKDIKLENTTMSPARKRLLRELFNPKRDEDELGEIGSTLLEDFVAEALYGPSKSKTREILLLDLRAYCGMWLLLQRKSDQEVKPERSWCLEQMGVNKDSIYRFIAIRQEGGRIILRSWEKIYSKHFREWIGIPRDALWVIPAESYDIVFYCSVGNRKVKIELDIDDVYLALFDPGKHGYISIDVNAGRLKFFDKSLKIMAVFLGGAPVSVMHLKSIVLEHYAGILALKRAIQQLSSKYNLDAAASLQIGEAGIVGKEKLKHIETYDGTVIPKEIRVPAEYASNILGMLNGAYIIASKWQRIPFDGSFLDQIAEDILMGNSVKLYTPHLELVEGLEEIFAIGNVSFLNKLPRNNILDIISTYLGESAGIVRQPQYYIPLLIATFDILSTEAQTYRHFLESLSRKLLEKVSFDTAVFDRLEDIIEYKRGDTLEGERKKVYRRLLEDIRTKLSRSTIVLYLIGVDGVSRRVYPVHPGRCNGDDGIRELFKSLSLELQKDGITVLEPRIIPVKSDGVLVYFTAWKRNHENGGSE